MSQFSLHDLRNHLYKSAEVKWSWSLGISLVGLIAAIMGAISAKPGIVAAAGVASISFTVLIAWLREWASTEILKADKCRRLVMQADTQGIPISSAQIAEVHSWGLGRKLQPAPFFGNYYQSAHGHGPRRLADVITESAYFTKFLAGQMQFGLWCFFGFSLFVSVIALSLADFANGLPASEIVAAAKAIAVFVAFLISSDVCILAKKYGDLSKAAELTFFQSDQLRLQEQPDITIVRMVAEDYGIALLQCPPIPNWLFLRHQDDLNKAYSAGHAQD